MIMVDIYFQFFSITIFILMLLVLSYYLIKIKILNKEIKDSENIIQRIINELKESEAALFIISSGGHKYAEDIEMFNIIPPALDKMNRWIQENQESLAAQEQEQKVSNNEDSQEKSDLWTP